MIKFFLKILCESATSGGRLEDVIGASECFPQFRRFCEPFFQLWKKLLLDLDILVLRAPFDVNITPKLYHAHFTPEIPDAAEQISVEIENVNRVLGSKFIKVRLFMFQTYWNINNRLSYLCLFFSRFPPSLCLSPSNRKPEIVCCPKTFDTKLPLISTDHRLLSTQVFEQMNCLFMLLSLYWKKSAFKLFTRKYKLLCQQLPLKRFIIVS